MQVVYKRRKGNPGRKKKEGERYPSGDLKRSETEREAKSVVIAARVRHTGLPEEKAASDLAGTILGRLLMAKKITNEEFEAGNKYAALCYRFYGLILGTKPTPQAQDLTRTRSYYSESEQSSVDSHEANRVSMTWTNTLATLARQGAGVQQTVRSVCVDDAADVDGLLFMPETQVGLLKRGLRALHRLYSLGKA